MSRQTILDEIRAEREYQDGEWGTEFDDSNTLNDWSTYVNIYVAQASTMTATPEEQRKNMLKAATLLVAAIETFDRNGQFAPRHYEDRVPAGTRPGDETAVQKFVTAGVDVRKMTSDAVVSVLDEIQIARAAVEALLNSTTTDAQLIQRTKSIDTLLRLIERLVRTAHKLKRKTHLRPGETVK